MDFMFRQILRYAPKFVFAIDYNDVDEKYRALLQGFLYAAIANNYIVVISDVWTFGLGHPCQTGQSFERTDKMITDEEIENFISILHDKNKVIVHTN